MHVSFVSQQCILLRGPRSMEQRHGQTYALEASFVILAACPAQSPAQQAQSPVYQSSC